MEAKDTVMKREQLLPLILAKFYGLDPEMDIDWEVLEIGCKAQAEITWHIAKQAGYEQHERDMRDGVADNKAISEHLIAKGHKEVVEWIGGCIRTGDCFQEDGSVAYRAGDIVITKALWQAKLKEWGN